MKKIIAMLLFVMLAFGLVACGGGNGNGAEDATRAADYIYQLYKDKNVITADFEVPSKYTLPANQKEYTIDWTVEFKNGATAGVTVKDSTNAGYKLIDIDESVEADVEFTLTLTVSDADGNTATKSINSKVPAMTKLSWEEFRAAKDNDAVIIEGVVTGIVECSKENDLYIEDEDGGYFVYNMKTKPSEMGLKVGMTVRVTGLRGTYSGIAQVASPTVEIIDSTIKEVTPTDITDAYLAAEDLTVDELFLKQSMFVTIKGVTILGQNAGNDTYYDFVLGGKTTYVRISTSTSMLSSTDDAAFKEKVASHIGYTADVTGLVSVYGGKIYLVPIDQYAFDNITVAQRTPEEQVAFEKTLLANYTTVSQSGETTLEATGKLYPEVVITWALDKEYDFASIVDGKLVVKLPAAETKIKLTATLQSGDATTTQEYEVTVKAAPTIVALPVDQVALGTNYKFNLTQVKLDNKVLYFAGEMKNTYYLGTTTDPEAAVDVYLEDAGNGQYYLAFMDGIVPTYIHVYEGEKTDGSKTATLTLVTQQDRACKWDYNPYIKSVTTTLSVGGAEKTYYIGTYSNYDTFSLSETSYVLNSDNTHKPAYGTSSFVAQFCTTVDAATVSDTNKIATEYAAVKVTDSVKAATTITLPGYGMYFQNVEITWALDKTYDFAAIADGKLTVTALPAEETVIKLVATYKSGTTTENKEYTITVAAGSSTPKDVTSVDTETEYMISSNNANGPLYFKGTIASGRIDGTADYTAAVKVKLEATANAGEYKIYFMDGNTKKYIGMDSGNADSSCFVISTTADTNDYVWVIDATAKTIVNKGVSTRGIATQNTSTFTNFSSYATSNFSDSIYDPAWFVK